MSDTAGYLQAARHRYWVHLVTHVDDYESGAETPEGPPKDKRCGVVMGTLMANPRVGDVAVFSQGDKDNTGTEIGISGCVTSTSVFDAPFAAAPEFYAAFEEGFGRGANWIECKVRQLSDPDPASLDSGDSAA